MMEIHEACGMPFDSYEHWSGCVIDREELYDDPYVNGAFSEDEPEVDELDCG